jgi:hypothetical protein
MGTLPGVRSDRRVAREMSWEDFDVQIIRRPFTMSASVRGKFLRLLMKAFMGASNTAGF